MNHPHSNEESHQSVKLQAQTFSEEHPNKEDRYVYEPLEDFSSEVYEEINSKESPPSNQESDVTTNTVNKTDGESPSSNHVTTNTVNKTDGESPSSNHGTTNTVNETDSESPSSNHGTTNTVNVADDEVAVPIELLQEDEVPVSSNDPISTVYEAVTPPETLSLMSAAGTDDQEVGKKMESESKSTKEQALTCSSEGNSYEKEPTRDESPAYEATTAL